MNLTKRATAWFLTLVMALSLIPQTVFAKETTASSLQYDVTQKINEDKTEAMISLAFTETEKVQLQKVTLPDGEERTEDLSVITYTISKNGVYDFKVDYIKEGEKREEIIPVEVVEVGKAETEVYADQASELNVDLKLKGATFFKGTPEWGITENFVDYKNVEVPYDEWQLMQLNIEIPYQNGLEVKSVEPSTESLYPQYSSVKKDDTHSKWTYTFFFKKDGTYDFTINYSVNGIEKSSVKSYTVEGLVAIKDIAMRKHLIDIYGDLTGLNYQGGQYVTKKILATTLYDPSGNIYFDFGKDGDNGSTAKYTTSLDGLQYLTNIQGMYLFKCSNLNSGETIEPITKTYYPNMKYLRITDITNNKTDLPKNSYTPEMIATAIGNMPNLSELSISGTGFKDFAILNKLNGELSIIICKDNEVESIEGIEKHNEISSLNLANNKIKCIEPLSRTKLDILRFLDLGGNQIFDLRPLSNLPQSIIGKVSFGARRQNITYEKPIIASFENDSYKIELPMPIDIDDTLTDTAQVAVVFDGGNQKEYVTTESDGKTFISIPKTEVHNSKENPFDKAEFSFEFNNDNGADSRTKGAFTGNVSFKVSPFAEEYHVVYNFASGTKGKELPQEIINLLPVDPAKYAEGTTINAIQLDETEIEVTDGMWTFKGYDADSKVANADNADKDRNIKFTGTWEFKQKASDINTVPTITASDKTLTVEDTFNPRKDVTANDVEDGDLTSEIEVLKNEVDTGKAGVYEVTYKVTDRQGASSTKSIKVTVKEKSASGVPGTSVNQTNKPDKDKTTGTETPKASETTKTPKTREASDFGMWMAFMLISCALLSCAGILKRRSRD